MLPTTPTQGRFPSLLHSPSNSPPLSVIHDGHDKVQDNKTLDIYFLHWFYNSIQTSNLSLTLILSWIF